MRISPNPPGNTVQEKTTKPLQKGSEYDNCTLSYSEMIPERSSYPLSHSEVAPSLLLPAGTGDDLPQRELRRPHAFPVELLDRHLLWSVPLNAPRQSVGTLRRYLFSGPACGGVRGLLAGGRDGSSHRNFPSASRCSAWASSASP